MSELTDKINNTTQALRQLGIVTRHAILNEELEAIDRMGHVEIMQHPAYKDIVPGGHEATDKCSFYRVGECRSWFDTEDGPSKLDAVRLAAKIVALGRER